MHTDRAGIPSKLRAFEAASRLELRGYGDPLSMRVRVRRSGFGGMGWLRAQYMECSTWNAVHGG